MIGTYYRLSLADEDVGADKAESNSIQGQRGLVEGYIMAPRTGNRAASGVRGRWLLRHIYKPSCVSAANSRCTGRKGENDCRKGLFPVRP